MPLGVEGLPRQWQLDRGVVERPALAADNLQHQHIVRIVVRACTLGACGSEIDVGLQWATKLELEAAAELLELGQHPIEERERDGGAAVEQLVDTRHIEGRAIGGVLAGCDRLRRRA